MVRVLIVGVFTPKHSTNEWMAQGFEKLGYEVERWDYRHAVAKYSTSIAMRPRLMNLVRGVRFDFAIICKGCPQIIPLVQDLSDMYNTALWWMDPKSTAKMTEAHRIASCCHRVICNNYDAMKWIEEHSFVPAYRVAEGYPSDIYYSKPRMDREDFGVFVGNASKDRVKFLEKAIQRCNGKLQVYGDGYAGTSIIAERPIYGKQEADVYRRAAFGINLTRDSGYSDRVLKMLACGLHVLTDGTDELDEDMATAFDGIHQRGLSQYANRNHMLQAVGEMLIANASAVQVLHETQPIHELTWTKQCQKIAKIMETV